MEKMRVLDLFSGIGGFSLGLERTGGFTLDLPLTDTGNVAILEARS